MQTERVVMKRFIKHVSTYRINIHLPFLACSSFPRQKQVKIHANKTSRRETFRKTRVQFCSSSNRAAPSSVSPFTCCIAVDPVSLTGAAYVSHLEHPVVLAGFLASLGFTAWYGAASERCPLRCRERTGPLLPGSRDVRIR